MKTAVSEMTVDTTHKRMRERRPENRFRSTEAGAVAEPVEFFIDLVPIELKSWSHRSGATRSDLPIACRLNLRGACGGGLAFDKVNHRTVLGVPVRVDDIGRADDLDIVLLDKINDSILNITAEITVVQNDVAI